MRAPALRVRHLARYRDIAGLLRRHAFPDGGRGGLSEERERRARAGELAAELEALGPTFIKLGQLLSTRSDLVPEEHVEALSRLQDRVGPFPYAQAREIVEEELGRPLSRLFRRFEPRPRAAASLSQIHRARLRGGREVAVKVQRPGIGEIIRDDMEALSEAALFLERRTRWGRRWEIARALDEFRQSLTRELDFAREAESLRRLADDLAQFDRILVPEPHVELTGRRVLTMDFVRGRKIARLSERRRREIGGPELAQQLFRAYLQQIIVDGFFHADPHPGNVLLTDDGRIAILDLGMVSRVGPELQRRLLTLMLAISEGRSEDSASAAIELGSAREGFREEEFRRRVSALVLEHMDETIEQMDIGRIIVDIARVSAGCGLRLPRELTLIGKALLNLDQVVRELDPGFEPAEAVREESSRLIQERLQRRMTRANATAGLLELQDFAEKLPSRIGRVLDTVGGNELRLKIDAIDETLVIQGMQKIANRIASGLMLAALIIGAALMMQVETTFRVLEYPGLAILLFAAAAVGSAALLADILYYDENRRTRVRPGRRPDD